MARCIEVAIGPHLPVWGVVTFVLENNETRNARVGLEVPIQICVLSLYRGDPKSHTVQDVGLGASLGVPISRFYGFISEI